MLEITVPRMEFFDNDLQEFIIYEEVTLELEHSLVSLSKWESKWEIPFLGDKEKTDGQTIDYIRCMTISPDVPPETYNHLTSEIVNKVNEYIASSQTATWFDEAKNQPKGNKETITAELIYYWMIALTIPFECQNWHLNRLLTLVKVCNIKNEPTKGGRKMSRSEQAARNRALNEKRRAEMKTKG